MYHVDVQHLHLLSGRLRNFKQKKSDLWNASCPVCGDSRKTDRKARLYFYRGKNQLMVKCHNCQYSSSFARFLKKYFPEEYNNYAFERWKDAAPTPLKPLPAEPKKQLTGRYRKPSELSIPSLASLAATHPARAYVEHRRIPLDRLDELFYAKDYKGWLDKEWPDHGKKDLLPDERIVIPFVNRDGHITVVTGRALAEQTIRYISVKILDEHKVFALDRLKKGKFYVTEGPFDSMFLPNAIAAGDANLVGTMDYVVELGFTGGTLVFDNEPRNAQVVAQYEVAIDNGYNIAILPESKYKDLNEMVLANLSTDWIRNHIDRYTFSGLTAKMKLAEWRRDGRT